MKNRIVFWTVINFWVILFLGVLYTTYESWTEGACATAHGIKIGSCAMQNFFKKWFQAMLLAFAKIAILDIFILSAAFSVVKTTEIFEGCDPKFFWILFGLHNSSIFLIETIYPNYFRILTLNVIKSLIELHEGENYWRPRREAYEMNEQP
ncbi:hypothetical protein SPOG_03479 [Schizosaccharomyces cryophilus OY26]|uniref:Uncharacterized protein n=1 Tax=Schizosaccharomyces cryophilus (strain OY26 / ATCC MYA-4695 / CBS 11777 / NBRC 106824 / NRRL Y48691) TaxID=653667 RepID=S9VVA5_SCHCR|nr:uncharacterized protein SPOG_03479 [Schizosaccharomyces cryophilus OY26]EPY50010.1 hypothetical protein SPOG_03479 [Schizosaccharomyces cryophilus OY26]